MKFSYFRLIWVALFCFAAFCYLTHWSGALPGYSDENRAFHYQLISPLIYWMCWPAIHLFERIDMAYLMYGIVGMMNIILVYLLVKEWFGIRMACIVSMFWMLYDFPLVYSKVLYYTPWHFMFLLLAWLVFTYAYRSNKTRYLIVVGMCFALMFITNAAASPLILLTFGFMILSYYFRVLGECAPTYWKEILFIGMGFICVVGMFEACVYWKAAMSPRDYEPYMQSIVKYGQITSSWTAEKGSQLHVTLKNLFRHTFLKSTQDGIRNSFLVLLMLSGLILSIKKPDKKTLFWIALGLCGLLAEFAGYTLFSMPFFRRKFFWLCLPAVLMMGVAMSYGINHKVKSMRYVFRGMLAVYAIMAMVNCIQITQSQFSLDPIHNYLAEQGISKKDIITNFHINSIRDSKTGNRTSLVPMHDRVTQDEKDRDIYFRIHWPLVEAAYRQGRIKYYLSSAIGHPANMGKNDSRLLKTKPLKTWNSHPMNFKYWSVYPKKEVIQLFALKDILE